MKKQIVIYPKQEMVDRCDHYYLAEAYLDMEEIHSIVGGKYTLLNYPFDTGEKYMEAQKYIVKLAEKMIHSYGQAFNREKRVGFSDRQWTIVLCIWLRHFLFDIYYKYCKLEQVRNEEIYLIGTDVFPEEKCMVDFTRSCIRSISKNAYIWTYIAKAMQIECVIRNSIHKTHKNVFYNRLVGVIKHPKKVVYWGLRKLHLDKSRVQKEIFENIKSNVHTLLVETLLPDGQEAEISLHTSGKVGYLIPNQVIDLNWVIVKKYIKDIQFRKRIMQEAFVPRSEFEKIAHEAVMEFMPIAYVEAFDEMYAKATEITKDWNVKRFYSCYTSIELLDYCIALMVPRGIEINLLQHSAAYGGRPLSAIGECMYADRFLSWGWEGLHYDWLHAKVRPVAIVRQPVCPSFSQVQVIDKILYTPNVGEISDFGQGNVIGDYIGNSMQFIGTLSKELRSQVYLRYDPNDDFNQELVSRCKKTYPEVHYETREEKSFTDSALESKYIISDYYGSTHIEAICLGKPFVMFEGIKFSYKDTFFEKHVKPLKDAGIYMEDGVQLAEILNQKGDDISWLYGEEIKSTYKKYLNVFTRMDLDVEKVWNEVIEKA